MAIDGHPVANLKPRWLVDSHNLACVFVARYSHLPRTFQIFTIGAADGGRLDANHHIPALGLGCGHFVERYPVLPQKVDC
jgi:hypothetical protein